MPERTLADGTVIEFPEGMTADQIDAVLAKKNATEAGRAPVPSHEPENPDPLGDPIGGLKSLAGFIRQNPGATGAVIGGAIGGLGGGLGAIPGAMSGAYLGGVGGQSYGIADKAWNKGIVKPSFIDDWQDAASAGTKGFVQEAIAGPLSRLIPAGAHRLYKGLLNPSKAVTSEFGDVAAQSLERSVPIGRMTGVNPTDEALTESTRAARRMVHEGEKAGAPNVHANEIIPELRGVRDELQKSADIGNRPQMSEVADRARGIKDAMEGPLRPVGREVGFSGAADLPPGARPGPPGAGGMPPANTPRTMVQPGALTPGGQPTQLPPLTIAPGAPRTGVASQAYDARGLPVSVTGTATPPLSTRGVAAPRGAGLQPISPTQHGSLSPQTMVQSRAYGPGGLPVQTAVPGQTIMRRHRQGITPTRSQALKEKAQDAYHGAQRQLEEGTITELGPKDLMNKAVARGHQKALESRFPGLGAQNRNSQELIGILRAVSEAVERNEKRLPLGGGRDVASIVAGLGMGGATGNVPAGVATAALTRLMSSPFFGSLLAIAGHHGGKHIPAAMRTGRMGLAALTTPDEEPEQ